MKRIDVLDESFLSELSERPVIGIDIGSRQSKAVLLKGEDLYFSLLPTGFFMQETADPLIFDLTKQAGIDRSDVEYIVSTGYGRIGLHFEDVPHQLVTEISCHAMGAHALNTEIRTIIDIGGQDSKAISVNPEDGSVDEFAMNDKCAAGTGRFLERIAEVLGIDVTKIGPVAAEAIHPETISSQCVVFAESEIISGRAKGLAVSDLAAGIHLSVAKRVKGLVGRVGLRQPILFTGGVSNNVGMWKAFEELLGCPLTKVKLDTTYAGALGAAVFAGRYAKSEASRQRRKEAEPDTMLAGLMTAIERQREGFVSHQTGREKQIASLCAYTPVELMEASGAAHIRLMEAGSQQEVMAGEVYTQSVFCDITKSVIGGFETGNPYYKSIDALYTFYTCECMRKTAEVLNEKYIPASTYNLPRKRKESVSIDYLAGEVRGFREDLEKLTGAVISEETIRENIREYNRARQQIRQIAEYRKGEYPLISGTDFRQIITAFYDLPVAELNKQLKQITEKLALRKAAETNRNQSRGSKKVRLMIAGGIVANGDTKLVRIAEEELGAVVVAEDNCTGIKPVWNDIPEDGDVYEAIAKGYLTQPPCLRMTPAEDTLNFSSELASEYQVDGVIFYYLKFCPSFAIMSREYIEMFRRKNIPVLVISGDYANGDEGQLRTRLEAFIEMLQKEVEEHDG